MAALALALIHLIAGRPLRVDRTTAVRLMLLGGVAYASETWLFFSALELAPASLLSLVFYSFPLITAVIAAVTRIEPFRPTTAVALILGSAGVLTVFGVARGDLRGPLLALGAAAAVAVYFILAGLLVRGVPASVAATWTAAGAALSLSASAVLSRAGWTLGVLPGGLALGLLTVVAFTALYAAFSRIGSARAAIAQMFEPVVTVVLAALLLGERITGRVALGALLIISSLPVLSIRGRRTAPPAADSI